MQNNFSDMSMDVSSFHNITDKYFVGGYNGKQFRIAPQTKVFLPKIIANHLAWVLISQMVNEKGIDENQTNQHVYADSLKRQILSIRDKKGFIKELATEVYDIDPNGGSRKVYINDKNEVIADAPNEQTEDSVFDGNSTVEIEGEQVTTDYDSLSDEELIKQAGNEWIEGLEDKTTLTRKERTKLVSLLSGN